MAKCRAETSMQELSKDLAEFMRIKYSSCMMCEGFYGNNFGQPVCSTCHLFLFSADINKEEGEEVYTGKADSDDSGTEEPDVAQDFCPLLVHPSAKNVRATHSHKMDKLAERIASLTLPRDRDSDYVPEGLVDSLPPEELKCTEIKDEARCMITATYKLRKLTVLLVVFKNLDDISLWTAGMVCPRWQQLLQGETSETQWREYIKLRWPLFSPQYKVKNWKTIYTKLLESSPCRYCLESMMLQSTPPIEENSWRHRRLRSELKTLKSDPPEGIRAEPLDRHCCHWQASITGPQGSPYVGGLFLLYLQIPDSYPMKPPKVQFITKIFHPNISRHGDVGLDSIHYNWSLALTISKVLISIQSLLTDPYCHVCMEPAIGKLYTINRDEFERIARLWTWKYAMHDFLMPMDIDLNGV